MLEFYKWSLAQRSLVTLLIALCVLAQTLAVVLGRYRRPKSRSRSLETLLEVTVLFGIIVLSLLQGQGQQSHFSSLIVETGYIALRYFAAAAVALLSFIVMAAAKKAWPLLIVFVSCMTLPVVEDISGRIYVWIYIIALLYWLLRGTHISILRYREIQTGISALSVKSAIDSMHSGVLFYMPDGFILLANAKMQELMTAFTGKIQRNGRDFYTRILSGELLSGCARAEYEEQTIYLLPDQTAWMFTREELRVKNKPYTQLAATDITEQWTLTAELKRQEEYLELHGEELTDTIGNLQTLSRERELQKARMRAHDSLGQRLTLLLHTIRSEQELDLGLLHSVSQGLTEDLQSDKSASVARERLDVLCQTYKTVGAEITLDGALPEDDIKGNLFADIISESAVNAVRHAFATEISVRIRHSADGWRAEITDNGSPPQKPVIEGNGLGAMRAAVERHGGTLDISVDPCFALSVALPGDVTEEADE
jgi:signal transduction histidine kinase